MVSKLSRPQCVNNKAQQNHVHILQDKMYMCGWHMKNKILGPVSIWRPSYLRMAISMLKIRRPLGRLIFNMGIAIPGKTVFLFETAPSKKVKPTKMIFLFSFSPADL